ncbi:hypothetical protein [Microtetraspora fusca]|uniref:hypothetical protein n=1 Tax=Microtetraspora fusca TaxID=1997 RepID=UPI0014711956|nr:hypothetical protein [Microtetraspora fusca]
MSVLETRTGLGRQHVASVTKVMEVKTRHPHLLDHVHPARTRVEATPPQRPTLGAREEQRARLVLDIGHDVLLERLDDGLRETDDPPFRL